MRDPTTLVRVFSDVSVAFLYYTPRKLCLWEGILFSCCPSVRPSECVSVTFCFLNILENHWWNFIKFICTRLYYTPRKLCLWEGILFSCCPSVRPSECVSVTFCFLNILENHWWNFIKFICTRLYYTPRKLCLWEGILFSCCPSVPPSECVSVTFCFLNILENHWWNFINFICTRQILLIEN